MSKGTKITPIRIPEELAAEMTASIATANLTRKDTPYNTTTWILAAIREKIAHLKRSRKVKHDPLSREPGTVQDSPAMQSTEQTQV